MSLYHEAEKFLVNSDGIAGSLKSRVFSAKELKSKPAQLYALVAEVSKWSPILKEVIEKSQLLSLERKLSPSLSLLLVHDLLLSAKGIAAPVKHPLRQAVERHKARLAAELARARVRRGYASIDALKESLRPESLGHDITEVATNGDTHQAKTCPQPRWLRVNTLKTTLAEQLSTTFAGYTSVPTLDEVLASPSKNPKILHVDAHIPSLLALPRSTTLSTLPAFAQGLLIAQDKASCFPAYLLNPLPSDGPIIDACAAPGNKTTHLAALLHRRSSPNVGPTPKIYACEKDKARAQVLQKMVSLAGATDVVTLRAGQDFLRLDPQKEPWSQVGALLLDPSCSGSGIVGRDEREAAIVLPSKTTDSTTTNAKGSRPRKRKRGTKVHRSPSPIPAVDVERPRDTEEADLDSASALQRRLAPLAIFQTKLLLHAFSFPSARKIAYSTCSVHAEENEKVVWGALLGPTAEEHGWRMLRRDEQVEGMRGWVVRGDAAACGLDGNGDVLDAGEVEGTGLDEMIRKQSKAVRERVRDACIRCEMGTKEGTQGFFVAGFVKKQFLGRESEEVVSIGLTGLGDDGNGKQSEGEEEEWEGISDT